MRSFSKNRLAISLVLTFLALSLNGLWEIRADDNIFSSASLLLITSQILIFISLCFFGYKILEGFKNPLKRSSLIFLTLIFMAVWLYTLFDYILPFSMKFYIPVGENLARKYGINWFWMDWGDWVQCVSVYLLGIFLYLSTLILNIVLKPKTKKFKK